MKVLLVRHAESKFNKIIRETCEELHVENEQKNLVYYLKVKKDKDLIDAGITELGKLQCSESVKLNHEKLKKVKVVLVSPMGRALETSKLMFITHLQTYYKENEQKHDVRFIVVPELRECLESVCDIVLGSKYKENDYPNYDFSRLKKLEEIFGYNWFFETTYDQYLRQILKEEVEKSKDEDDFAKSFRVLDVMTRQLPRYLEQGREIYFRVHKFKIWLNEFLEQNKFDQGEVAIVGHSFYFEVFCAKTFDEQFQPKNSEKLKNCEVKEIEVAKNEYL